MNTFLYLICHKIDTIVPNDANYWYSGHVLYLILWYQYDSDIWYSFCDMCFESQCTHTPILHIFVDIHQYKVKY